MTFLLVEDCSGIARAQDAQHDRATRATTARQMGTHMVKAIRVHETGGPEVLKYEDIEIPAPDKGEIQIRQHAIGVNFLHVYYPTG